MPKRPCELGHIWVNCSLLNVSDWTARIAGGPNRNRTLSRSTFLRRNERLSFTESPTVRGDNRIGKITKAALRMKKPRVMSIMGLPKAGNGYGNGVFVVPEQARCLHTCRVMSAEGKGKQLVNVGDAIPTRGSDVKNKKVKGVYRKMIQIPELKLAYENISKSRSTKGVTNDTLDGYSEGQIRDLHKQLKDHSFKFKPIRRIHIPKKGGGTRPLGIPSPKDKVAQRAACNVLEEIYEGEGIFLDCSHGFRPGKSTHTALSQVRG